ncbi:hypothetical protein PROFUN_07975 [Planoprotostelium fungivorum]|uniref:Uncharacterized protein n=1 Tax=Planoprotostelium fungivorum TaxID=1890364 RepID=A0A2P6MV77_9EUKA|nr:hypothetical protein PROFUN_07975 [Planoprotostelium fungivorum]
MTSFFFAKTIIQGRSSLKPDEYGVRLRFRANVVTSFQEVDTLTLADGHILSSVSHQLDGENETAVRKEAAKIAKEAARSTALNSCLPQLLDLMLDLDSSVPFVRVYFRPSARRRDSARCRDSGAPLRIRGGINGAHLNTGSPTKEGS